MNRINFDASDGRFFCVINSEKWKNRKQFENVSIFFLLAWAEILFRLFAIASANLIYEVCVVLWALLLAVAESYGVYLKLLKGISTIAMLLWRSESRRQVREISTRNYVVYNSVRLMRHTSMDVELWELLDEFQTSLSHIPLLWCFHLSNGKRDFTSHFGTMKFIYSIEVKWCHTQQSRAKLTLTTRHRWSNIKQIYQRIMCVGGIHRVLAFVHDKIDKRDWTWQI